MSKKSLFNTYKLLKLLKENTDKDHTVSQAKLREIVGKENAKRILGDKGTFTRRLRELADAFNSDESGELLEEEEFQIVYPGYLNKGKNGQIYFNQPLSYFELSFLLKKIEVSVEFTSDEKASLKKRLIKANSSLFFNEDSIDSQAVIVDADNPVDLIDEDIANKITIIRNNIIKRRMLELIAISEDDSTKSVKETIRVTPYRIIKKNNRYWMIGNRHAIPREDKPWDDYNEDLFSYRIDLLRNIVTAHTEAETFIHWTMTKNMRPKTSYWRSGCGGETKARYNEEIRNKLARFDKCIYEIEFVHNERIKVNL
ncbi:MAG: hypothetical protein ACI4DU_06090 [Lachnospiraceae bacterium]